MNVSLSKNEQIVLFVVVFLVVAVAGTIIFLMPRFDEIEASREALNQQRAQFAQLNEELGLQAFKNMEEQIMDAFHLGKETSEAFYSEAFTSYNADRLIRGVLAQLDLTIDNLSISRLSTYDMRLALHTDEDVWTILSELVAVQNAKDVLNEILLAGDFTEAVIDEPEDLSDMDAVKLYLMTASKPEGLAFLEKHWDNMNLEFTAAAREFLVRFDETILMQSVRFEIPMTEEKANDLSMLVYEIDQVQRNETENFKTTYISQMTWRDREDEDKIGAGMDNADRVYTVQILFFVIRPMVEPTFDYEATFEGTW
jgi:hypothetical protein